MHTRQSIIKFINYEFSMRLRESINYAAAKKLFSSFCTRDCEKPASVSSQLVYSILNSCRPFCGRLTTYTDFESGEKWSREPSSSLEKVHAIKNNRRRVGWTEKVTYYLESFRGTRLDFAQISIALCSSTFDASSTSFALPCTLAYRNDRIKWNYD